MNRLVLDRFRRGIFLKLPSRQVIDILVATGFDFVIIDLEHSQLTPGDVIALVHHADVAGIPTVVRLPRLDVGLVNQLLEAGAGGIQLSTVTDAQTVRDLRAAMTYAPLGARSIGNAHRLAGFGHQPLAEYVHEYGEHAPLAIVQIETPQTADPLSEIAAAGADVLFLGSGDLSVAYEFDTNRVAVREREIREAAAAAGIHVGAVGLDPADGRFGVVGADIPLLAGALRQALARL